MLTPTQLDQLSRQAVGFPATLASMQSDLAKQTRLLEQLEVLTEGSQPKISPLPQFLDLTMANPSLVTGETLRFIRGWISSAGAVELILHLGEGGVFFHFWLPAGGNSQVLPITPEYPLIVSRGVRVWLETVGQAQDYHCKLVAFPT